ncbi:MAG: phage portal protein [Alkalibacterium sp.]|nr:phage portal protein [Alkalibacterium sp.]
MKKVGVRLGIIDQLQSLSDHKKIEIDEAAYKRIAKNKGIYAGYVEGWHNVHETKSDGTQATRTALSMGMGKVLPRKMASLIFNEKAKLSISERGKDDSENTQDSKAAAFVIETLKDNGFYKHFQRYLEYGYALSGMAIKVYEYDGQVKLAYAAADAFYPLGNDSNTIDEALFVTEEYKDGKYYTLLEWNEWEGDIYVITNELFESSEKGQLGTKTTLDKIYDGLDPRVEIEGLRRPLFVYFKLNEANNKNLQSPLGISLFENSYDTLYMLDYLYDFWINEFKLGKRRIAVDHSMIRPFIDLNGTQRMAFDPEETVYTALNMEDQPVKDLSVEIRSREIIESINALLDILSMQVGLSTGTFTFDGNSVKTATEVISENSLTYQTKNSHETLVEEGIKELITSIMDIAALYELYNGPIDNIDVSIDFDDSIAQDRTQNLAFYATAVSSNMIPNLEAIQRVFNVTKEEALDWMEQIAKEKGRSVSPEDADGFGIGSVNVGE